MEVPAERERECAEYHGPQRNHNPDQLRQYTGCANLYPSSAVVAGSFTTNYAYDCASGFLNQITPPNNIATGYIYDNTGRTVQVEQKAGNGAFDRITKTTFDDIDLFVTTTSDDAASKLVTHTDYDGLGRVIATVDAAGRRTEKAYAYGTCDNTQKLTTCALSYELASNPYSPPSTPTGWTLTTHNTGLFVSQSTVTATRYAGSAVPAPFVTTGANTTVSGTVSRVGNGIQVMTPANTQLSLSTLQGCSGPGVSTTDQAGNVRTMCADGLGRLTAVLEPNGVLTNYSYDAQDNLTGVSPQCLSGNGYTWSPAGSTGQTRTFTYSLSRMSSAANPESGTVNYSYDGNGNMTCRSDAAHTDTLMYDVLTGPPASATPLLPARHSRRRRVRHRRRLT